MKPPLVIRGWSSHNLARARMAYEYDIFLSYKRRPGWTPWVRDFFKTALEDYVGPINRGLRVFVDEQIETGASWPLDLRQKLARSRLLVAVLSPEYFSSEWCVREMAHFLEREQLHGFRTPENTAGLILPVQLHGDDYPTLVKTMQARPMQRYAIRGMTEKSPDGYAFDAEMRLWAPEILRALGRAPETEANWLHCTGNGFVDQLRQPPPEYGEANRPLL